jgi:hypothetical protein
MNQTKSSAETSHLNRLHILTGAPELVPAMFPATSHQVAMVRGTVSGGFPTAAKNLIKHLVKR